MASGIRGLLGSGPSLSRMCALLIALVTMAAAGCGGSTPTGARPEQSAHSEHRAARAAQPPATPRHSTAETHTTGGSTTVPGSSRS